MEKNRDRPTNIPCWTSIDDTNTDTSMEICVFARREKERERKYVENIEKRERQRRGIILNISSRSYDRFALWIGIKIQDLE